MLWLDFFRQQAPCHLSHDYATLLFHAQGETNHAGFAIADQWRECLAKE